MTESRLIKFTLLACLPLIISLHWHINHMTLNPHYGKVFYRLGMECQNKCSLNKQLAYFKKAVFYDPNLNDAYFQMGIIYGKKGDNEKEFASYRKVALLDHRNFDAYFKIGFYYFQKGELDYALRYLLQSNRRNPNAPETFYYLARVYEQKEMYSEAVYYYVTLIMWHVPRSAEICERVWSISKIPGQLQMVTERLMMLWNAEKYDLWKQIDQYIKTDQVPEFIRKSREYD